MGVVGRAALRACGLRTIPRGVFSPIPTTTLGLPPATTTAVRGELLHEDAGLLPLAAASLTATGLSPGCGMVTAVHAAAAGGGFGEAKAPAKGGAGTAAAAAAATAAPDWSPAAAADGCCDAEPPPDTLLAGG